MAEKSAGALSDLVLFHSCSTLLSRRRNVYEYYSDGYAVYLLS